MKRLSINRHCLIILLFLMGFCGSAYALQGSTGAKGSNAQALHSLGITGSGVKIGFVSGGNPYKNHEAFQGNVTNARFPSYLSENETWHETWMAGIAISRGGVAHPNDIGVAPDASIYSGLVANGDAYIEDALDWMIVTNQCKVIMSGFHEPYDPYNPNDEYYPDGTSSLSLMYDYYAYNYNVVFANAAGNYIYDPCTGITTCNITVFGDAYNGITTAGLRPVELDNYQRVGSVSNYGPTLDGRKKPDIAAPSNCQTVPTNTSPTAWSSTPDNGDGATSFSTPHTAGVAALLLQYANQTTEPHDGNNVVIKAVIINSAFPNIMGKDNRYTDPTAWHPQKGYGRIDACRAYRTLSAGNITAGTLADSNLGWAYGTLDDSQADTYYINAQRGERLVLTITWNRKVTRSRKHSWDPWVYQNEPAPIFNMDLTVTDPDGSVVYSENDTINNLIKMDMPLEVTGQYEITLANTTSKIRDYGIAFELLTPIAGDFDMDCIVDGYDLMQMAVDWLGTATIADVDMDSDGSVNNTDFARFSDNWLKSDPRYFNP